MPRAELVRTLLDTWGVSAQDFPEGGSPSEKLRFLLNYAVLAPSSHNSQPWYFKLAGDAVLLYADRTRALPVVDPHDRELVISCGASLFFLRVAIRHFGFEDEVALYPDAEDPDLLARIRLGSERPATSEDSRLFYAIYARRTNRNPFEDTPLPKGLIHELVRAAGTEGAQFHIVHDEDTREAVGALIAEGDRIQWADPHFRRELAAWLHPNRSLSRDGIPGYAMGLVDLMSLVAPAAIRTFDMGNGTAAHDRDLAAGSPMLGVLATSGDTPRDWLRAGQALGAVLLIACAEGVSASFLNQPVEVEALRPVLAATLDAEDNPQMLLRMGYGPEPQLTPRRTVSEVLLS